MEKTRERRLDEAEIVNQEVQQISTEKVRAAMNRMKTGKAVGPDDIPVETWRCLGAAERKRSCVKGNSITH